MAKQGHNLPVLTGHNTVPKYTAALRRIFVHAKLQRSLLDDPSDVLETTQDKKAGKKVLPFTLDDVAKIFPGSGYVQQLQHSRTKNSRRLYTAHFWLPILAAFSGARIEELAQLTVSDIVCDRETGIDCLRITDEGVAGDGGQKSVKNTSSKRLLPLHDTVIAIGFLKFVNECRHAGSDSSGLFELERGSESGRLGKAISHWFSRSDDKNGFLQRCGVQTHERDVQGKIVSSKSFHSWRHTVRDVLRMQPHPRTGGSIAEFEIDYVTGHAPGGSAGVNYGTGKRPLDLIHELVNAINYPGVDFGAIRWKAKGDQPGNGK